MKENQQEKFERQMDEEYAGGPSGLEIINKNMIRTSSAPELTESLNRLLKPGAEVDPNGIASGEPGAKLDAGKAPIMQGVIQYFPRALKAVAQLSAYGAKKYAWEGWRTVPDGINRYGNAMGRHQLDQAIDGPWDDGEGGSGALHDTSIAWNALAKLELVLQEMEET